MMGKILSYLVGLITGFIVGVIYISGIFDYIFKFVPLN